MILDGRKMKFASRKRLNQQTKAEKQFSPAMPIHLSKKQMVGQKSFLTQIIEMARPGRLELPTLCLEGRRSIQLSYGRTVQSILPSSTYSYFLENFSFKSRCNRCNNGLFGRIFGKSETKSNSLGLGQAHVNLLEQMRVNL